MVQVTPKQCGKNVRMNFGKINEVLEMPNLIEVQKNSYKWFREKGLKEVFRDVSSITDYNGNLVLNFTDYRIDDTPKYTIAECKERDVTYAAPLRVTATLWNKETGMRAAAYLAYWSNRQPAYTQILALWGHSGLCGATYP